MGFGFVNFETNDAALSAINALNGTELPQGKFMRVSLARPAWQANIHSNVYVSGLPIDASDDDIFNIFIGYKIESIRRLFDSVTGTFRGIAVIRLDSAEIVPELISRMNGFLLPNGLIVQVRIWKPEFRSEKIDGSLPSPSATKIGTQSATSPPEWERIWNQFIPSTNSTTSLFIFHLPIDTTDRILETLFGPFGKLVSVKAVVGRGYGFVNYDDPNSAAMAVRNLNGFKISQNKYLKVEYKK